MSQSDSRLLILSQSDCKPSNYLIQYLPSCGTSISCICCTLLRPGRGSNAGIKAVNWRFRQKSSSHERRLRMFVLCSSLSSICKGLLFVLLQSIVSRLVFLFLIINTIPSGAILAICNIDKLCNFTNSTSYVLSSWRD